MTIITSLAPPRPAPPCPPGLTPPRTSLPRSKAEVICSALTHQGYDFGFVHVKAVDDTGHDRRVEMKVGGNKGAVEAVGKVPGGVGSRHVPHGTWRVSLAACSQGLHCGRGQMLGTCLHGTACQM